MKKSKLITFRISLVIKISKSKAQNDISQQFNQSPENRVAYVGQGSSGVQDDGTGSN